MPIEERVAVELPATIKTSNYTVLPGDVGREIQFQSTTPIAAILPPVGTVGNGFNLVIRNIGDGLLTISPTSPDLIDGSASISLSNGDWHWIRADGTEWKSVAQTGGASPGSGGGLKSVQVFTASGTWTKPAGINLVKVTVVGAGGGGGAYQGGSANGSAGGGGGGAAIRLIDVSSVSSVVVTIGTGGAGGIAGANNGSSGGTSSFGAFASATGGAGGKYNQQDGLQSDGGVGSSGDLNIKGSAGSSGGYVSAVAGAGGASIFGGGAGGRLTPPGASGENAGAYGGGGGGVTNTSGPATAGGDGADGVVFVEEYA